MVEFCTVCGTSLPKGDLTIRGGKLFTSHDYSCPSCGQPAGSEKEAADVEEEPSPEKDIVFKKGRKEVQ